MRARVARRLGAAALLALAAWGQGLARADSPAAALPAPQAASSAPGAAVPRAVALDLQEEVHRVAVSARNLYGVEIRGSIPVVTYRPRGAGPFPLAVVNHGRALAERRAQVGQQRYEVLARYLVSKGFTVFVPTRLGYGETFGQGDPEESGACNDLRFEPMSVAASDQILATVEYARGLPWVDASRWVALGQSVGGLATVALAWRNPPGLVAAINFSGGAGGNPELRPGQPCSPQRLEYLWGAKAESSRVPMLWVYWANDRYWGAEWPQRWFKAWSDGGGKAAFHQLPPVGSDGHAGLSLAMDRWVPLVESYLADVGFNRPGLPERPPASGFASVDDLTRLPLGPAGKGFYERRFLTAKPPRAFAIGPGGALGWASGDWAIGRALGFCQAPRGVVCSLYAVDDDVVWPQP